MLLYKVYLNDLIVGMIIFDIILILCEYLLCMNQNRPEDKGMYYVFVAV